MSLQSSVVLDRGHEATGKEAASAKAGALRLPAFYQPLVTVILFALAWMEGWYKRTDFSTDAISYLDISRAIPLHQWKMIFNPLWSMGYPVLLAAARPFFPADSGGEWLSIHVVNMAIFVGAWCAFLFLLRTLAWRIPAAHRERAWRFLFLAGACIFASIQLCIDSVSRVGPDLLVSTLFFLATALMVRLVASESRREAWKHAALLGVTLAAGYWVKGIFLALSAGLLAVALLALWRRKANVLPAFFAGALFAVLIAPYVAGLSWSYGKFTMGESGPLNYAFHVNLLPRWTNWQGEPEGYGKPIHPTHQLATDPDIYSFAEPYHNTYPPFGNIAYWYQGYRRFWSARYQAIAIGRDLDYLAHALMPQPIFYAVALAILLLLLTGTVRREWLRQMGRNWVWMLPAAIGILLYVQVHLEDRYLGSFLTILVLAPFVAAAFLFDRLPAKLVMGLSVLMAVGAAANFAIVNRDVLAHMRSGYTYAQNPQWKLGLALERAGLRPDDAMAVVGGPNASCTWAYIAHLRIIAEVGGEPFDQHHPVPSDESGPISHFWHATAEEQGEIVSVLRTTGARAAIVSEKPAEISAPAGWHPLPGTQTWIYWLQ
ncbi:MAG TPA: hypothetical protein VL346_06480 [Acidobacteriaceae bacterium]|nr:hypothetical protein [Acidobacteriaceae bacterium]